MYCKYCGNNISEDSRFCKFCGKIVTEANQKTDPSTVAENSYFKCDDLEIVPTCDKQVDFGLSPKEDTPMRVDISKNTIFANEIVVNLRMIGLTAILWIVCLGLFAVHRSNDLSKDTPLLGSCYDQLHEIIIGNIDDHDWEYWYASKLHVIELCIKYDLDQNDPHLAIAKAIVDDVIPASEIMYDYDDSPLVGNIRFSSETGGLTSSNASYYKEKGDAIVKKYNIKQDKVEQIKADALKSAENARKEFHERVIEHRERSFASEREDFMMHSAIILLSVTIIGRYIIKFFRWVFKNASE